MQRQPPVLALQRQAFVRDPEAAEAVAIEIADVVQHPVKPLRVVGEGVAVARVKIDDTQHGAGFGLLRVIHLDGLPRPLQQGPPLRVIGRLRPAGHAADNHRHETEPGFCHKAEDLPKRAFVTRNVPTAVRADGR